VCPTSNLEPASEQAQHLFIRKVEFVSLQMIHLVERKPIKVLELTHHNRWCDLQLLSKLHISDSVPRHFFKNALIFAAGYPQHHALRPPPSIRFSFLGYQRNIVLAMKQYVTSLMKKGVPELVVTFFFNGRISHFLVETR
jgi:hypothetical protein